MAFSAVMNARKKTLDEAAKSLKPGERLLRALELSELCCALRESGRAAAKKDRDALHD